MYPICAPREEGFLRVSKLHRLFYAAYGNPEGIPVVVLHGGPGAGCSDALSRLFDLSQWNVFMFDQRGAMRSEPFASMEENSSPHLVADIEALRVHFGIEKWVLFGGSWGSTLALLYGETYPDRCLGFILRGIFLARAQDWLHLLDGMGKIFPEAYEPCLLHIPEEERGDLISAYHRRLFDPDPAVQIGAAEAFMRFDTICATHLPNPAALEQTMQNQKLVLGVAKAFFHYAKNRFFLAPNQILEQIGKIAHLPSIIVHGRWDAITLPEMAYLLHKSWEGSQLRMIPDGGHSSNDPAIAAALATATDGFVKLF